ncbi:MAG: thiosulfohydrolase SoxB [Sulfurifustis sp.]
MNLSRREFLQLIALAAAGAGLGGCQHGRTTRSSGHDLYDIEPFGNVTLLHITDCHAQLLPIYFREPAVNIGVGEASGRPPHRVGDALLQYYGIPRGTPEAYALTHLDFEEAARRYGKVGGFAHLATLVKRLRASRPGRTLLLDGGDSWQGSATALWTRGQDMIDAQKLLGVEMTTGHWEFTYGAPRVQEVIARDYQGRIEFLAQNVNDATWDERVFTPYALREVNGVSVAVIGQAYPYTPIANPRYLIPDWTFGIEEERLQETVDAARGKGAHVVVLLSHNGMDIDLKLASRVRGIDVILGGHTHDAVPAPVLVPNGGGKTLVTNSGSHGKFLSLLDLDVRARRVADFRYRLLPVFADPLPADADMAAHIDKVRAPYRERLEKRLAVTETLLYRRGNFSGTFDQLIVDAMLEVLGAEIALSPGFRWGTTLLPGDAITFERVMDQTAVTYADCVSDELTGEQLAAILEDIADNLYNPDPYYQLGGDMVRVGGLTYTIDPTQPHGRRISDLAVRGRPLVAGKRYKVAHWASVQPHAEPAPPIWDIVSTYLRDRKFVRVGRPYTPRLRGVGDNAGVGI